MVLPYWFINISETTNYETRRGGGHSDVTPPQGGRSCAAETTILIINTLLAHGFDTSLFNDIPIIYPRIANSSRAVSTRTLPKAGSHGAMKRATRLNLQNSAADLQTLKHYIQFVPRPNIAPHHNPTLLLNLKLSIEILISISLIPLHQCPMDRSGWPTHPAPPPPYTYIIFTLEFADYISVSV